MGSVLYECTSTLLVTRLNNEQSCRVAYVLFRDVVRDVEFDYVCMYVVLSSGRAGVHKTSKGRGDRHFFYFLVSFALTCMYVYVSGAYV